MKSFVCGINFLTTVTFPDIATMSHVTDPSVAGHGSICFNERLALATYRSVIQAALETAQQRPELLPWQMPQT